VSLYIIQGLLAPELLSGVLKPDEEVLQVNVNRLRGWGDVHATDFCLGDRFKGHPQLLESS
jgi:hypothetical protein